MVGVDEVEEEEVVVAAMVGVVEEEEEMKMVWGSVWFGAWCSWLQGGVYRLSSPGGGGGGQPNFAPGDGDWQCPDPK